MNQSPDRSAQCFEMMYHQDTKTPRNQEIKKSKPVHRPGQAHMEARIAGDRRKAAGTDPEWRPPRIKGAAGAAPDPPP
jgi:hypothetical protein